jgi:DNA mismatch endonuclease (patch repair protein)
LKLRASFLVMDIFSEEQRSYVMRSVGSKDTKPERIVRSFLHRNGFRFRLHAKNLPGKPDLVLPRYRAVVFVNGCFWHRHKGCKRTTTPKTREKFWTNKFKKNVARDKRNYRQLMEMGWESIIIWECELRNLDVQAKTLRALASELARSG